jgi:hypothetical protein
MKISKKTVTAGACGFAMTMGIVIILVIFTMFLPFQVDPYIIFLLSLIVVFPLIWQRFNRLDGQKKIFGWTLIGLGIQLLVLPLPLMIMILKFPSTAGFLFGGIIFAGSVVLGMPAGLLTAAAGLFLISKKLYPLRY